LGGIAVIFVEGKDQLDSYNAGVFGSLVVAFIMLVYQKTIFKKNLPETGNNIK